MTRKERELQVRAKQLKDLLKSFSGEKKTPSIVAVKALVSLFEMFDLEHLFDGEYIKVVSDDCIFFSLHVVKSMNKKDAELFILTSKLLQDEGVQGVLTRQHGVSLAKEK